LYWFDATILPVVVFVFATEGTEITEDYVLFFKRNICSGVMLRVLIFVTVLPLHYCRGSESATRR
jgi:hypothetical protein